jgi:alpha-beta hydrolase superfamily lysophospholipase
MATETTFTLKDPQGFEIFIYKWAPQPGVPVKAVVQIAHGAAEHALRYKRFALFLNAAGYIVYANDHRGHWKTAGSLDKAGIAGEDGWNGMANDLKLISDRIRAKNPGLPLVLFGHSMGSFLGQQYIQSWGNELAAVVLSGTTGSLGDNTPQLIAAMEKAIQQEGRDAPSAIFGMMFAGFAAPFQPVKTGFEWLSRDEAEVQKYVDDPWCGFPFSNALAADMLKGGQEVWSTACEARVPTGLPVLMISGAMDPVGGFSAGVNALAARYRALGVKDLTIKLYEGCRHELLNELNRDEVQAYILSWLDAHVA